MQKSYETIGASFLIAFSLACGAGTGKFAHDEFKLYHQKDTNSSQLTSTPMGTHFNIQTFGRKDCVVKFGKDGSFTVQEEECKPGSITTPTPR